MKRLLWMTTISLVLMSCRGFADTIIQLFPNDGSGDNFGALIRDGADFIIVRGGTTIGYYDLLTGHPPGSGVGGSTVLFLDGGVARIGGQFYDLQQFGGPGTLNMTTFTLPANGQPFFQVPITLDFSADMIIIETGDLITVGGFTSGHVAFNLSDVDGLYYPAGGFATPEPGTLGTVGTGLLGLLTLAREKLRSRSRRVACNWR